MRIDSSPLNLTQSIAQTAQADPSGVQSRTNSRSAHGDQVQISSMASCLTTDPSRLSQLTAAVRSGAYNISSSQLASSMIEYAMQP